MKRVQRKRNIIKNDKLYSLLDMMNPRFKAEFPFSVETHVLRTGWGVGGQHYGIQAMCSQVRLIGLQSHYSFFPFALFFIPHSSREPSPFHLIFFTSSHSSSRFSFCFKDDEGEKYGDNQRNLRDIGPPQAVYLFRFFATCCHVHPVSCLMLFV